MVYLRQQRCVSCWSDPELARTTLRTIIESGSYPFIRVDINIYMTLLKVLSSMTLLFCVTPLFILIKSVHCSLTIVSLAYDG